MTFKFTQRLNVIQHTLRIKKSLHLQGFFYSIEYVINYIFERIEFFT